MSNLVPLFSNPDESDLWNNEAGAWCNIRIIFQPPYRNVTHKNVPQQMNTV